MSDTIFSRIVSGEIPANFLYEDEYCVVINDINPQMPIHMLVIPRKAIPRLVDAEQDDQALLGHLLMVAKRMAQHRGIGDGFRIAINNGRDGGQTVFHLHVHVLGGQSMSEQGLV